MPFRIILLVLGTVLSASAQTDFNLQAKWYFGGYGDELGKAALIVKDIDNNGVNDIITTAVDESSYERYGFFSVIEFDATKNTFVTKKISRLFFNEITSMAIEDIDKNGSYEILIGFDNGQVKVLDAQTFRELNSFSTRTGEASYFNPNVVTSILLADLDNNGGQDVIATNGDSTYLYDLSFRLAKKFKTKGGKAVVANIDEDPAFETIYSGGEVLEISETQQKKEFQFYVRDKIITKLRLADMNADGYSDIVYSSNDTVFSFSGILKRRIKSYPKKPSNGDVTDFQLYDYNNDGVLDLFMGNDQFEVLFVYNGKDASLLFSLNDTKRFGLESLAIGQLDNKPGVEMIWTMGTGCSCKDHFFVYDMNSRSLKWQSKYHVANFRAFDAGLAGGNTEKEVVVGSYGDFLQYYEYGFLARYNMASKFLNLETSDRISALGFESISAIKIGDIDNDGKNEILAGVTSSYAFSSVVIFDENFVMLKRVQLDGMDIVTDILVEDVDGDSKNEIIASLGTNVGGSTSPNDYKNYIYILDGATTLVKWRSPRLAGIASMIGNLRIGNVDDDAAKELIAVKYKIAYAYNSPAVLYVIDLLTHSIKKDSSLAYSSAALYDVDNDNVKEILAGTNSGQLALLDGRNFNVKKTLSVGNSSINAVEMADINGDNTAEYIFSTPHQVKILDTTIDNIASTDTLNSRVGIFGSMKVFPGSGNTAEILLNAGHTLMSFQVKTVPAAKPLGFSLLTPVNHDKLPVGTNQVIFKWETKNDNTQPSYTFYITGPGLDKVVGGIKATNFSLPKTAFTRGVNYTWHVKASNAFGATETSSFDFMILDTFTGLESDPVISVFPNPFNNYLTMKGPPSSSVDYVRIIDITGREVFFNNDSRSFSSDLIIDRGLDFPPGLYVCRISVDGKVNTFRLLKH